VYELALVAALVLLLSGAAALLFWIAWGWLLALGLVLAALGLLVGVPTGMLYHVRLRIALAAGGPLPARWWLHPTPLHQRLDADQRRWVLRPFYAGAAGFLAIVLGCGLTVVGILRSPFGP
jgi:hypothetical protein